MDSKEVRASHFMFEDNKERTRQWLHAVLDDSDWFTPLDPKTDPLEDDQLFPPLERVLHEIALLPVSPSLSFVSDQWVLVIARGTVDGIEYVTYAESDYFMLALVKTYELWLQRNRILLQETAEIVGSFTPETSPGNPEPPVFTDPLLGYTNFDEMSKIKDPEDEAALLEEAMNGRR